MEVKGMFTKEDIINNVQWFTTGTPNHGYSNAEFSITKHNDGYGFIFRNGSERKLGDKHGRIEFGIVRPGVLAFRTSPNGYKIMKKGDSKYVTLHNRKGEKTFAVIEDYIGDYNIEYDKTFGLCYINLEKRK
jgi:hypothetical protein